MSLNEADTTDEPSWTGHISAFESPGGWVNIIIRTEGDSEASALDGAKILTALLADGRKHLTRAYPTAVSERDFEMDRMVYSGYSRFSVRDEPGEDIPAASEPIVYGFGALQ